MQHQIGNDKKRILDICNGLINGEVELIKGCREISSLGRKIGAVQEEVYFPFVAVDSETDHIPLGSSRQLYNSKFLKKADEEIIAFQAEMKTHIVQASQNLILFLTTED